MYVVTECCSESRMRSRTSRGVPEWSGGKDLYMGSPVLVTGKVSVFLVTYRDHREGPGGPPSGATIPGGQHGPSVGGDQPQVGWCAPPQGPKAPRVWGGGASTLLRGQVSPAPPAWPPPKMGFGAAAPLGVGTLEGAQPPPSPLYIVEVLRATNT